MGMEWEALLKGVVYLREKIDKVAMPLIGGKTFFYPMSVNIPTSESAECNFIRGVSFLYVMYVESGNNNIRYLLNKYEIYKLDAEKARKHLDIIQKMRTYLQHNLDMTCQRDSITKDDAYKWFSVTCGYVLPFRDDHWNKCLKTILEEANAFMENILYCIEQIRRDESCESICKEWIFRIDRYHHPSEFDDLVAKVAADMGREKLDVLKFRKKHYESWVKKLSELQPDYDFEYEGRKVIEYTLLTENIITLPITGRDIMDEYQLQPGPKIGELLEEASRIYKDNRCNKQELLDKLSEVL